MKVTVNRQGIIAMAMSREMDRALLEAAGNALVAYGIPNAPVWTSHYIRGLGVGLIGGHVYIVSNDFKTWWIEKGTKTRRPRRAKRLRFKSRLTGKILYRRYTRGSPAFHVLEKTARYAGWEYRET